MIFPCLANVKTDQIRQVLLDVSLDCSVLSSVGAVAPWRASIDVFGTWIAPATYLGEVWQVTFCANSDQIPHLLFVMPIEVGRLLSFALRF